ncbi:acyl carrier protein [Photobacterium lutimaris]|uniref:Acyl carrier protein n=1 Tax=Photobacterium lutimaris TaxID=388278 RepID=A0A2T3IWP8_9GAMM|nr:acyl carrier protein [Photobacterium lutimaris]PSU32889.1 hypothetical protein C9I99_14880 [Photobacterium lutimaris]TDR74125.1 acyl carrier protein [Photobacterium lutimaris]
MELSFENLKEEISIILDVTSEEVQTNTELTGSAHWDSFAMLSAAALVTKYTGAQLSMDDVSKLATVNDFISLINNSKDK